MATEELQSSVPSTSALALPSTDEPTNKSKSMAPPPSKKSRPNGATPKPILSRNYMREGDNVLIKLPSGVIKAIKVNATGTIGLGKYGSFKAKELIGKPYGHTYEILPEGIKVMKVTLTEIEETAANNENISSTGAQTLSFLDIEALKKEGLSGREIIQKQIEEHSAFELKTEYSKDKYLKRKEAKYLQAFTPMEPTVHNICEYNFDKVAAKIREIRPDVLSNMMTMANVRAGGRLLVVEDVHGLIVAAAVERMGGEGRIMLIHDIDSPPDIHLIDSFNFSASDLEPISSLHWAATEETWSPPPWPLEVEDLTPGVKSAKNSRDIAKVKKRKLQFDKAEEMRQDFFAGEFDGVILACQYEPWSVLERLLPKIAGSAPIVVHSPNLPTLYDLQSKLRSLPEFLAPSITEPWLRKYQVLPGRTHPEMAGFSHGGYLLSTIRVYDDVEASSISAGRRRATNRNKKIIEKPVADNISADAAAATVENSETESEAKLADQYVMSNEAAAPNFNQTFVEDISMQD